MSNNENDNFKKTEFTEEEREGINTLLQLKLGKDFITSRPGAGGSRFAYIESWRVISLANKVFGFDGWSCTVVDISPDFVEQTAGGKYSVGVTAVVRVTLKNGISHEDVGYGICEHPKRASAIENAKKEAVSDARKRTLRLFGDMLGNCLYDKKYLKELKNKKSTVRVLTDEDLETYGAGSCSRYNTRNLTNGFGGGFNNNNNYKNNNLINKPPQGAQPSSTIKPQSAPILKKENPIATNISNNNFSNMNGYNNNNKVNGFNNNNNNNGFNKNNVNNINNSNNSAQIFNNKSNPGNFNTNNSNPFQNKSIPAPNIHPQTFTSTLTAEEQDKLDLEAMRNFESSKNMNMNI
eukprot:TRINITY_DN4167_c0_g1_i2.p1 TRINITY_DN4167_c0_g1~~TRINITY_DN4167_c0_g1_i2.p1  ORF type:complete len:350 (+),score=125.86 TRINITY_DN4167_c0_g1_i2:124-1173(+)